MRVFMKAICRIALEIGLTTRAGPINDLFDTTTLSTNGCNSFLIQSEKEVTSSSGTTYF